MNRRIESFNLRKPENSGKYQSSLLRQDEMDALCSNCLQVFLRGFPTVWAASQKFIDFGICSPVKGENGSVWAWNMRVRLGEGKSHAIWVLSETLSPPIEKFFAQDLQLLRPPALLPTTNKPQNREERGAITRIYKFGKISRVVGGSLFLVGYWQNEATFCGRRRDGALIFRISRQILGLADRVLLRGGAGKLERYWAD